jgi:hypothetical protein
MCAEIGGSPVPVKPDHGELWVNVRDYGAKADAGVTDNSGPFQAAVDALIAKLAGKPALQGVVHIPSAPAGYMLTKSIWVDAPNIEIRGEGWGSNVQMHYYFKNSAFIFGVRRVEQVSVNGQTITASIDASNRPDLYGKLDTSAAPAPSTRWGIRTKGSSYLQFQACSLSSGAKSAAGWPYVDNWTETTKLTVEFCIEPPDGQTFPALAPLLGMGSIIYEASPFLVYVAEDPTKLVVSFRTSDMGAGLFTPKRSFALSIAGVTPPYRIALQFDLDNAVVMAFLNGVQVPLYWQNYLAPISPYPFAPGLGLRFQQTEHYPFMIGAQGWSGASPMSDVGTGIDLRLYGLRLSNTLRYQNNGSGQPQHRVDSPATPINDVYAYFTSDANTICHLPCTDNPATAGRVVSVISGDTAGISGIMSGFFLNTANGGGIAYNAIRDIAIASATGGGQTICLGGVLMMTIENVKATSGFNAIGNLSMYANYFVYIRNCWLDATDAPYFGAFQLTCARDICFGSSGRVTMRHLGGSADWQNVLVAFDSANSECIVKISNGCTVETSRSPT